MVLVVVAFNKHDSTSHLEQCGSPPERASNLGRKIVRLKVGTKKRSSSDQTKKLGSQSLFGHFVSEIYIAKLVKDIEASNYNSNIVHLISQLQ